MTEFEFFDTSIILYAKVDDSSPKHVIAKELLGQKIMDGEPCILRWREKVTRATKSADCAEMRMFRKIGYFVHFGEIGE